jgi:hypothetical protein
MNTTVPLRFLVGVMRLIAVYFGLRSLDGIGQAMMYSMQTAMTPDAANDMPSVWVLYIPILCFYLALVAAVWFVAPLICRVVVTSQPEEVQDSTSEVTWNEVMIFLTGCLFMGWGLTQLADDLTPILSAKAQKLRFEVELVDQIGFFTTALLMGFGGLMMARFPSLYRWIQRRRKE